jgi:hypothetical protein
MLIKKQSGLRLSRNDIVRHLIDQATLDSQEGIKRHVKKTTPHPQEQPKKSNIEERFRTDIQVHHFKTWIRTHDQPQDTHSFKHFLADSQLPEHALRGLYEAKMRSAGYSDEDLHLFQDAWKSMIAEDLEYMPLIQVWSVIHILFTSGSRHTRQQVLVLGKSLTGASPRKTPYMLRT